MQEIGLRVINLVLVFRVDLVIWLHCLSWHCDLETYLTPFHNQRPKANFEFPDMDIHP